MTNTVNGFASPINMLSTFLRRINALPPRVLGVRHQSKLAGEGVRRGTFYDSDSCGEEEEAGGKEGEEKGFEDFKKTIGM